MFFSTDSGHRRSDEVVELRRCHADRVYRAPPHTVLSSHLEIAPSRSPPPPTATLILTNSDQYWRTCQSAPPGDPAPSLHDYFLHTASTERICSSYWSTASSARFFITGSAWVAAVNPSAPARGRYNPASCCLRVELRLQLVCRSCVSMTPVAKAGPDSSAFSRFSLAISSSTLFKSVIGLNLP